MALETEIIRDVYVNCGLPPQRTLPLTIVVPYINQALRYYDAGLELSSKGLMLKIWGPFVATGIDMAVSNSLRFGEAAMAEIAVDAAETDWSQIRIVNSLEAVETAQQSAEYAVAFYGTPKKMRFSWDPSQDSRRIRISYEETAADPQTVNAAIATIPDYYIPMVAARVALDCIADLYERAPERGAALAVREGRLTQKLAEWEKQWDWKRFSPQGGGRTRRGAFNAGRNGWGRSDGPL